MASLTGRVVSGVAGLHWTRRLFTENRIGRALAMRFVAGETLDEAMTCARELNSWGASVSLDHLGEHVAERSRAEQARDDYLAALRAIAGSGIEANVSVKLSQLGLGFDDDLAGRSLAAVAAEAADCDTTVTIDMEESALTDAAIKLYSSAQLDFGNLGIALQAYLLRTGDDLRALAPLGGHIRLCKGAYQEPPGVAWRRRRQVDASFDTLLTDLFRRGEATPAVATHDEARIALARQLAPFRRGDFEFQMLYGVRRGLQRNLVAQGYRLRVYLPYGSNWYPYLTRRIAERPANLLFFLRAVIDRS